MESLDWVPLYIHRLKASAAWKDLNDFQFGWYMKLLVEAVDRGGYLPSNPEELWRIAGAKSGAYFTKWGGPELVSRYFRRTDDGTDRIYNPRMLTVIGQQSEKLVSKRKRSEGISLCTDIDFALPAWIPKETWDEYILMRNKIRKPMTTRAKKLAVKALERLLDRGFDPEEVLNQSILNSWQGLFEVRADGQDKEKRTGRVSTTEARTRKNREILSSVFRERHGDFEMAGPVDAAEPGGHTERGDGSLVDDESIVIPPTGD